MLTDDDAKEHLTLSHFGLISRVEFIKRCESLFKPISTVAILIFSFISLSGCFSNHLQVATLTRTYSVLSYEHGAMIPQVDENLRVQKIKEVCPSGIYETIEKETKTVGQYRFRTTILFRCLQDK